MTAKLYSLYILVHLICDMILMAGIFFELDLVNNHTFHFLDLFSIKVLKLFHAFYVKTWKIILLQQFKHFDFNVCTVFQSALVCFPNILLYCYFGKLATDSYAAMSKSMYESNWQNLPIGLQKYVVLIISNTQIPVFYDGFGIVILNLQTSTSVSYQFLGFLNEFELKQK